MAERGYRGRSSELPRGEIGRARAWLAEQGLDAADPDPFIDLPLIAKMGGLALATPRAWRNRSRPEYTGRGKLEGADRFPDPDDTRYPTKPQWRAVSTILPYLWRRGAWPPPAVEQAA